MIPYYLPPDYKMTLQQLLQSDPDFLTDEDLSNL